MHNYIKRTAGYMLILMIFSTVFSGIPLTPVPAVFPFAPNRSYIAKDHMMSVAVTCDRLFIEDWASLLPGIRVLEPIP
jgi:hypothetical protein